MTRLIQLQQDGIRKVAVVSEPKLRLLAPFASIYELALHAINHGVKLTDLIAQSVTDETLSYDDVYSGQSAWRILPAADHPEEAARCLVSGTGLTHTASAKNRNAMHVQDAAQAVTLTDSMKIFYSGVERGKPAAGEIGVAPEWFYKGHGDILRAHGEPLLTPSYAEDGGEEPEIAGVYIVADDGTPHRIGFTTGNEFSDHKFEKQNYLYLAGSKLRTCSIGPELVIGHDFQSVPGTVTVERDGQTLWTAAIKSGEAEMCHSLANMEHHHFKFEGHRRAGDVHIHFYGADAFSFGAGVALQRGDVMKVQWDGFGRTLCNPLEVAEEKDAVVAVKSM